MSMNDEKDAPEKIELPNEEPNVKVRLDDDEPDDTGPGKDESSDDTPVDRPEQAAKGRDDKTGQWTKNKRERAERHREKQGWERERQEYDRRLRMLQEDGDRRYREMQDSLERMRGQGGGGQQSDPFAHRLKDLDAQIDQELQIIESNEHRGYARYRELTDQRTALITQRVLAQHSAEQRRNQPAPNPYEPRRPIIEAEFPWTMDNRYKDLSRKAWTYRQYLIDIEGRPDTVDTDREALAQTVARYGADYGLRPPAAPPSQRTRGIYAAPPSRGAPDRSGRPREVELPNELVRGSGLDAAALQRAVRNSLNDEN